MRNFELHQVKIAPFVGQDFIFRGHTLVSGGIGSGKTRLIAASLKAWQEYSLAIKEASLSGLYSILGLKKPNIASVVNFPERILFSESFLEFKHNYVEHAVSERFNVSRLKCAACGFEFSLGARFSGEGIVCAYLASKEELALFNDYGFSLAINIDKKTFESELAELPIHLVIHQGELNSNLSQLQFDAVIRNTLSYWTNDFKFLGFKRETLPCCQKCASPKVSSFKTIDPKLNWLKTLFDYYCELKDKSNNEAICISRLLLNFAKLENNLTLVLDDATATLANDARLIIKTILSTIPYDCQLIFVADSYFKDAFNSWINLNGDISDEKPIAASNLKAISDRIEPNIELSWPVKIPLRANIGGATGTLPLVRELLAKSLKAKILGLSAKSFLAKNNTCAACKNREKNCKRCKNTRLSNEILTVTFLNLNYAGILNEKIGELAKKLKSVPKLGSMLMELDKLGLSNRNLSTKLKSLSTCEQSLIVAYTSKAKSLELPRLQRKSDLIKADSLKDTEVFIWR